MFTNLEPLDSVRHRALRLMPQGYGFAATTMTVPIAASEFVEIAKYYPIVFPAAGNKPQALLSMREGTNPFVDPDGKWTVPYVPAHLRRHPFILSHPSAEKQSLVLVETAAASLSEAKGERLFDDEGQQSPVLKRIVTFLTQFQAEVEQTETLMQSVEEVLVARQIEIALAGAQKHVINGLRVIDPEKFAAVSDETFLSWRRRGILPLIYAHMASLSNVRRLASLQMAPPPVPQTAVM